MTVSVLASFRKEVVVFVVKTFEITAVKGISYLLHEIIVEIEIVKHRKPHSESFLRFYQMTNVRTGVMPAGRA